MKKRVLSIILVLMFILSIAPMGIINSFAEELSKPTIQVENASGTPGDTVQVKINLKNNPGLSSLKLKIAYDENLTLTNVAFDSAFGAYVTAPTPYANPQTLSMISPLADITTSGLFATLTFKISDEAENGDTANVSVSYNADDVFNTNFQNVDFKIENGIVNIFTGVPGDVDGNKEVNNKDAILLFRYVAEWKNLDVDEYALDCDGSGAVNNKDAIYLFRYVAEWKNLTPETPYYGPSLICQHNLVATAAKEATCTQDGNIAYWQCTLCKKYFRDANAISVVSYEEIVKKASHNYVIGADGKRYCSVCGDRPDDTGDGNITYYIYNNDAYLESIGVENPNPETYDSASGLTLKNLSVPGYIFDGWYDSEGSAGERIKKIPVGEKGDIELYAHWSLKEYTIQFSSDDALVNVPNKTYTVNKGTTLPIPSLGGYIFMGWTKDVEITLTDTDESKITKQTEEVVSSISKGTIGDIILHPNWTSKRNMTKPVSKLGDPLITEDSNNGKIYFSYEIGTMENVPLYQIGERFQSVNGLVQTISTTKTASISEENAKTITDTISNASTNSTAWSLSEDWNERTSTSRTDTEQSVYTQEESNTLAKTDSSTYSLNSSVGGSSSLTDTSGYSATMAGEQNHSKTVQNKKIDTNTKIKETGQNFGLSVDAKYSQSAGASVPLEVVDVEAKKGFEIGAGIDYSNYKKNTETNTKTKENTSTTQDGWKNSLSYTGYGSSVSTNEKNWNTTTGYSTSNSTTQSKTVSGTLSEMIAVTAGYGKEYSKGGSKEDSQSFVSSSENSNQYSDALTYSNEEIKTTTKSITMNGEKEGWYRVVCAGTVHVFAVVTYDIATCAYGISTYSVMDEETYDFIDYSRSTANFNDNENGVLPFEVPIEVNKYVNSKISKSADLEINNSTGVITNYSGDEEIVIIPSYIRVNNQDGTYSSIKVKGISSDVFKGNKNIVAVKLSDYITEIPDSAFEGCISLKNVQSIGITKIGKNAFKGCTNLDEFTVSTLVKSIGENAFEGVEKININAKNADVAESIKDSGAKNVVLYLECIEESDNITLVFNDTVKVVEINGGGKEYKNLRIESNAEKTILNNIVINKCSRIPLTISSDELAFNRATIMAPSYVMLLSKDAKISLFGTNTLYSEYDNAVVCRKIDLERISNDVQAELNVNGNIYMCDSLNPESKTYLNISSGKIINIGEEEFEKYIKGSYSITFDANGGELSVFSKDVFYGQSYGELPQPKRNGFTFLGWYTSSTNGEKITSETMVEGLENYTIYAQWKVNEFDVSWNNGVGYTITVNRTSSPNKGASTGQINSGSTVYYGDVLSISYQKNDYYFITSSGKTSITVTSNINSGDIYASAKLNEVSGWTKASSLPSGADVIETKWQYTLREYTTNSASSLSGWTKYDTKRTSWGPTQGAVYSNPSNGVRNVWPEQYVASQTTHYVYYHRYNGSGAWSDDKNAPNWARHSGPDVTSPLPNGYYSSVTGQRFSGAACAACGATNHWHLDRTYTVDNYATRWYYQEPVYTYYYYRDLSKETTSGDPTGQSNVSNVVKYVKYRAK